MDALSEIARAVLYEGYLLWPYRRSWLKNRQRWTFGGVYPPAYSVASGGVDRAAVQAECLVEAAGGASVDVSVRFLHAVQRQVLEWRNDGVRPVDELVVAGQRALTW